MRLIDADELIKYIQENVPLKYFMGRDIGKADKNMFHIVNEIRAYPTADPVKHGHWITMDAVTDDGYKTQHTRCSVCNHSGVRSWKACPYCTAIMDEKEKPSCSCYTEHGHCVGTKEIDPVSCGGNKKFCIYDKERT